MTETAPIVRFARALAHMLLLAACSGAMASCNSSATTWPQSAQAASSSPSSSLGVDAGAPAPVTTPDQKKSSRRPPKLPHDSRLVCKEDRDCVFVGRRPCMCTECGTSWREVLNRQAVKKLRASWARKRCVAQPCPKCESHLLGTKPICRAGQCTVE
jgi:hypothetical protein